MSTALEAASLIMIPTSYSDGLLASVKPNDGAGDFTFTRGSNTSATRVNADGNIEKGYENLLKQSNTFSDAAWSGLFKTSGILGYDGTNNAWEITKPSQPYTSIYQSVSANGVWTFSLYAKANTLDKISIRNQTDSEKADIDLLNGLITYTSSGIVHSDIELISNDWYRLQITFSGSTSQIAIYVAWNNSTAGSVYIQDAQLEIGLAATEVITSGATKGKAGLLENEPRFDYSGDATCPSLLLEPSRTNLIKYSEYYGDLAPTRITLTSNYGISPEGVQNAAAIFNTTENGRHNLNGAYFVVTSGTSYVNSVFAKAGTITKMKLRMFSGGGTDIGFNDGDFDLTNGTATGTGAGIESYGNGWYRCYVVDSPTSSVSNARFNIELLDANGGISYVGSVTDYIEIYGSQVEEGSYPTSYIPNHSGGSVTRGAEDATNTGTIDADNDFTLFLQTKGNADADLGVFFSGFGYLDTNSSAEIRFRYSSTNYVSNADPSVDFKFLLRKDGTNLKMYVNGTLEHTITTLPTGTQDINFEEGQHKQFLIFPEALSDADCISLTTL